MGSAPKDAMNPSCFPADPPRSRGHTAIRAREGAFHRPPLAEFGLGARSIGGVTEGVCVRSGCGAGGAEGGRVALDRPDVVRGIPKPNYSRKESFGQKTKAQKTKGNNQKQVPLGAKNKYSMPMGSKRPPPSRHPAIHRPKHTAYPPRRDNNTMTPTVHLLAAKCISRRNRVQFGWLRSGWDHILGGVTVVPSGSTGWLDI